MENGSKMFSVSFDIDVESVPIVVQMESIELQNDLDLKAKFLPKKLLEFCRVFPKKSLKRYPKISKRAQIHSFSWKYLSLRTLLF